MTLEERIAAIERHLFGRAQTEEVVAAEQAVAEAAIDVAAEEAPAAAKPVRDGGPASV